MRQRTHALHSAVSAFNLWGPEAMVQSEMPSRSPAGHVQLQLRDATMFQSPPQQYSQPDSEVQYAATLAEWQHLFLDVCGHALRESDPEAMVRTELRSRSPAYHGESQAHNAMAWQTPPSKVDAAAPSEQVHRAATHSCRERQHMRRNVATLRERQRVEGAWRSGNACR